jgi:hypothetical protein
MVFQFWPVLEIEKRAPANRGQFAQCRLSAPCGRNQLFRYEFAAFVIAAMRKLTAYFAKHDIHIGLSPLVKLVQNPQLPGHRGQGRPAAWPSATRLPLFPEIRNWGPSSIVLLPDRSMRIVGMGAIDQLASASLAAVFSIAMLITAHLFIDYRSAKTDAISIGLPSCFGVGARTSMCRGFDGVL